MARPKNTQLKQKILDAAIYQFKSAGYHESTYSGIAKECGISRNLVQYHFPKKELLAIAFMEQMLEQAIEELGFTEEEINGNADKITKVGACFFTLLLEEKGTRRFLQDIICSRKLCESVLAFNTNWALKHYRIDADFDRSAVQRSVIVHMGGFYELMFWSLSNNRTMDIEAELRRVVDAFVEALV